MFFFSLVNLIIMQHTNYKASSICTWGQMALSSNRWSIASEIMNILGYWGTQYAESIFQRVNSYYPIPEHLS
jgi:hypothetical protein